MIKQQRTKFCWWYYYYWRLLVVSSILLVTKCHRLFRVFEIKYNYYKNSAVSNSWYNQKLPRFQNGKDPIHSSKSPVVDTLNFRIMNLKSRMVKSTNFQFPCIISSSTTMHNVTGKNVEFHISITRPQRTDFLSEYEISTTIQSFSICY
jgi:hypothetical protein